MKFPCLVSHAGLLSIALASHVHVPLEGDAKRMVQVADKDYEKPDYSIGVHCQPGSTRLVMEATQNSYEYFKPDISEFTSSTKIINVEDIDLTKFMSNDSVTKTNVFNTLAAQASALTNNTPKIGDMVTVIHTDSHTSYVGELCYFSESNTIIRDSNGKELSFNSNFWSIEKTPVEPTPHDLLKQAWFEQGQDVDDFIDYIVNEYGVMK